MSSIVSQKRISVCAVGYIIIGNFILHLGTVATTARESAMDTYSELPDN